MANISATDVAAVKQQLVASIVQETLKQKGMLIPTITDMSSFAQPGNDRVKFPRRAQMSAADKTEDTPLASQDLAFSTDDILLDKKKAIFTRLELLETIQAMPDIRAQVIQEMANELVLQIDKDIITEVQAVSTAAPDHLVAFATPSVIAKADILEARRLLRVANVPMDDNLWLGIHPDQEANLLAIGDFVQADTYGSPDGLRRGVLGRVYNFNVIVHNEFVPAEACYWHKSHVAYASQMSPTFKQDESLENVAEELLMAMVYGTKVLDSGVRGVKNNATGA